MNNITLLKIKIYIPCKTLYTIFLLLFSFMLIQAVYRLSSTQHHAGSGTRSGRRGRRGGGGDDSRLGGVNTN